MNMNHPDRTKLYLFYLWMSAPTGLPALNAVLDDLRDVELLHIMQSSTSAQARTVAWAEYGRRHNLADIHFEMAEVDVLNVQVTNLVLTSTLAAA